MKTIRFKHRHTLTHSESNVVLKPVLVHAVYSPTLFWAHKHTRAPNPHMCEVEELSAREKSMHFIDQVNNQEEL